MGEHTIRIEGMTCGSCERIIGKYVSRVPGVEVALINAEDGKLAVKCEEAALPDVKNAIREAGYRVAGDAPQGAEGKEDAKSANDAQDISVSYLMRNVMSTKPEWKAERTLMLYSAGSLVALLVLLAFMYLGMWKGIAGFEEKMLPLLGIGAVSVAALTGASYHFGSYHRPISCSIGMMEGMTFGMMAGFLVGALFGATNGMYWGSVFGLLVGCAAGVWAGRPSGVMGVMEGIMAGIMSGTMGAMLSVMLVAEPLHIFLALLALSCIIVLAGLSYMNVKELGRIGAQAKPVSFTSMASTNIIFFIVLSMIMVYGPKTGLVWSGL